MTTLKRTLLWETVWVTGLLLGVLHVLYSLRSVAWIQTYLTTIVAVLFLYVPVSVLSWRKRPIDFLDRNANDFFRSFGWFAGTALLIFPLFFAAAHAWMLWVWGATHFQSAPFEKLASLSAYQLLMVALPEEFFFRGYLQSTLNCLWPKRWRILGAVVGPAWIITALVFAAAHSFVVWQWWHFSIFFPALVFGWLREKTGTLTAPILWHALSNIFIDWFARSYS